MQDKNVLNAIGITNNNYKKNNNSNAKNNTVAMLIKVLAVIFTIIFSMYGFYLIDKVDYAILIIILSIVSGIFTYALGEIIQLLQDIKNK